MIAVLQFDQQFFGTIRRSRNRFHLSSRRGKIIFQFLPELCGEIAHLQRVPLIFPVYPIRNLGGAEPLETFGFEIISQLLDRHSCKQLFHGFSSRLNTPFHRQIRCFR